MLAGLREYHLQQGESCLPSTIQHQAVPPWLPWSPAVSLPPPAPTIIPFPSRTGPTDVTWPSIGPISGQGLANQRSGKSPPATPTLNSACRIPELRVRSVNPPWCQPSGTVPVPFRCRSCPLRRSFCDPPILVAPHGVATQKEDFWKPCLYRKHNHAESCKTPLS